MGLNERDLDVTMFSTSLLFIVITARSMEGDWKKDKETRANIMMKGSSSSKSVVDA